MAGAVLHMQMVGFGSLNLGPPYGDERVSTPGRYVCFHARATPGGPPGRRSSAPRPRGRARGDAEPRRASSADTHDRIGRSQAPDGRVFGVAGLLIELRVPRPRGSGPTPKRGARRLAAIYPFGSTSITGVKPRGQSHSSQQCDGAGWTPPFDQLLCAPRNVVAHGARSV
jgi:hypothetical protein